MLSTIRFRLTLWYAGALTLLLAAFAIVFYFALNLTVREIADESIEDASAALVETLRQRAAAGDQVDESGIRSTLEDLRFQFIVFAVFDPDKRAIASSPRLGDEVYLPPDPFNIETSTLPVSEIFRTSESGVGFLTMHGPRGTEIRVLTRKLQLSDETYVLAAVRPLTSQLELLSYVRIFIAAGIPIALLLSGLGGYYLAGKALKPVGEMAKSASSITSSRLAERVPRGRADDEIAELADAFNAMLERLESSFTNQRRFMADASHELRTPLAIIRGESEVALQRDQRPAGEYKESLDIIRNETARLSRIVDDLFILAKADSGGLEPKMSSFYLDETAADCVKALRSLCDKKGIKIEKAFTEGSHFKGDESLIRRMILNLLDNAVKYSQPGSSIAVTCYPEDGNFILEFANPGPAISEADRTRLFERFFRADEARSHAAEYGHGTGAGLGLSIAASIAVAHGGRVELVHSNGTETRFRATLPFDRGKDR